MADLAKEISNARLAKEVLENPMYVESYQVIEADILQMWIMTKTDEVEIREKLWLELKILRRLQNSIKETIDTGILAKRQSEDENVVKPI